MTTTTNSPQSEEAKQYEVVGTRPIRHDGVDKVIGAAKYGADIQLTGMLHGKVLRSPHAHAIIKSIDTTKAEALPGVHAVATNADFPGSDEVAEMKSTQWRALEPGKANERWAADNILAGPKALYHGHAIACLLYTSDAADE
mgnify:CR=1 FL=1